MNYTLTENGAPQLATSGHASLDLFSRIGGMRQKNSEVIVAEFIKAFNEDPKLAMQVTYWARAARDGAGERRVFHTILQFFATVQPDFIASNAKTLAEIGYWKDLVPYFSIDGVLATYKNAVLAKDNLACKWAPRKGDDAKMLKQVLDMTWSQYRHYLKENSATVEQQMAAKQFADIKYSSVPGAAMRKYKKSYGKRDGERFEQWKGDKSQKAAVSSSYPHDIYPLVCGSGYYGNSAGTDEALGEKQWASLPNYITEGERILPMCDVSGSMQTPAADNVTAMQVCISLGLYIAERGIGPYKDAMLTFSSNPAFIRVKESMSLREKFNFIRQANWDMSTDFAKAYRLILDTAKTFSLSRDQMPTMLLVFSDMQFDRCVRNGEQTALENLRKEFFDAGYIMPKVVFWNLRASDANGSPAQHDDKEVALVSGFNPVLMKALLQGEDFTPMGVMHNALKPIVLDYTHLSVNGIIVEAGGSEAPGILD
jgi:hypothetical protein